MDKQKVSLLGNDNVGGTVATAQKEGITVTIVFVLRRIEDVFNSN